MPSGESKPGNTTPDTVLISLAARGDEAAFGALYARHKGYVLRLAMRYTHDHDAAADVVQDVFIYILKKLPSLTLTAKLTTYLFPIVKNIALTSQRKAKARMRLVKEEGETPPARSPVESCIEKVVELLPEHQREVLLLRFVDDLSMEEIGQVLDIPSGTVKSRLHLAIKALRAHPELSRLFGLGTGVAGPEGGHSPGGGGVAGDGKNP